MKKYFIATVIAAMVVTDLVLSGMNVVAGLLIILAAFCVCALMDYSSRQESRTTSITKAARQNSRRSTISAHGSSSVRPSWDGWQRCSQELQYAK